MTGVEGEFAVAERKGPTAYICLADGTRIPGHGFGAAGLAVGELCFNTAMTGYQEILTDPSYAGQIVTFTFPHVGIVGANTEDHEAKAAAASGLIIRSAPQARSNWRARRISATGCRNRD